MSNACQITPNPDWVSAPYEEAGVVENEQQLAQRVTAIENSFKIKVTSEYEDRDGLLWYLIKEMK